MQTILGTHAALLACRLARKKAPELRSVSACLASLVAHDMGEFRTRNANLGKAPDNSRTTQLVQLSGTQTKRTAKHKRFAHHTRATICGCRPSRMSTSMSNGFTAAHRELVIMSHNRSLQLLILAMSLVNAHANTTSGSERGCAGRVIPAGGRGPGDTRWRPRAG